MNRTFLVCALMIAAAAASGAQQTTQSDPYQGTSNPPPNDSITSAPPATAPPAKPSPSQPLVTEPSQQPSQQPIQPQDQGQQPQPQYQAQPQYQPPSQSQSAPPQPGDPAYNPQGSPADGTDDGIVQVAPDQSGQPVQPALNQRGAAYNPDDDIVHPAPLGPGQLGEGTTIRARLLERLSTAESQSGEPFRTRVASDVLQDGQVLIPAGSEIDGRVMQVSSGHLGGHGSMRLNPDTVILPDGSRYHLYAQVTGTPGSRTRVGDEGSITPGSHLKRDSIEYGGAVGTGVVAGAVLGGPAGALAGTLVGASLVTAHLLINHPQATLEEGTTLLFTLTETLNLVPVTASGN